MRDQMRMLAQQAAWLLQPHLKKGSRVSAADLMGESGKATVSEAVGIFETKEEIHARLKAASSARAKANGDLED